MKRWMTASVFLLITVFAALGQARAELVPARVMLGKVELALSPSAVYNGAEVLASLVALDKMGVNHIQSPDKNKITLVKHDGESAIIETSLVQGEPMVSLDKVMATIGGEVVWDPDTRAARLIGHLQTVEFVNDTVSINCSLPAKPEVAKWDTAARIIIDIPFTKLATHAKEVYVGEGIVRRLRMGQLSEDTARVVVDLSKVTGYKIESTPIASRINVKIGDFPQASQVKTPKPAVEPFAVESITIQPVGDTQFDIVIATSAKGTASASCGINPARINIGLPGGTLAPGLRGSGNHPLIKSINYNQASSNPAKAGIELALKRVMGAEVEIDESCIRVSVRLPDRAGGRLSEKVVMIDAGHGGREKGAVCASVCEKDINLKIAQELAAELRKHGVTTMFTRGGDEAVSVATRPEMALNRGADFFISIHCNSNPRPNSVSGIETYYHMQELSPKALASAIHDGVCSVTGMCDRNIRSDRSLYDNGFGVLRGLRGTGLPGILLECGYLNHSSDRAKLLDPAYRTKLVQGIVRGLKVYVEGD